MPEDFGICISTNSGLRNILFRFQNTESSQDQAVCVYGGRLQKYGKSKRSEAPADGHRSDSPGIFYKFPAQRSSGSVREALRLSRPTGLLNVKIFSYFCRCPPYTHVRGPSCIRPPLGAAVPEPPDIAWALLTLRRVLAFVRFFPKSLPQISCHSQGSVIHLILSIMLIKLKHMR